MSARSTRTRAQRGFHPTTHLRSRSRAAVCGSSTSRTSSTSSFTERSTLPRRRTNDFGVRSADGASATSALCVRVCSAEETRGVRARACERARARISCARRRQAECAPSYDGRPGTASQREARGGGRHGWAVLRSRSRTLTFARAPARSRRFFFFSYVRFSLCVWPEVTPVVPHSPLGKTASSLKRRSAGTPQ